MVENNKPTIRFKGFTEAWEQRKFADMYEKVSEKNDLSFGTDRIISVANMYFKSEVYISDKEYLRTYNIFKLGDIAFEGNKSKDFAHGRFVENSIGDGIVSHVFDVFRPIREFDLLFWKYVVNNERLMGSILVRSTKSSTMMTNLVATDFLKESFRVPCLNEQKSIGQFFTHLDNLITLHQRKYEKLQNVKKSCLEKMFPKNGTNVPEIRFSGFTEAWEQRKVGELGEIVTGSTPPTEDKSNYNGKYLFVSPADIQNNRYVESTITTLSEKGFHKGRILKEGSTLFVSIGSTIGKVAQIKEKATTNQQINAIVPNVKYDSDFVLSLLINRSKHIKELAATQAVPIINKTSFSNVEIIITMNLDEQEKIGTFFKELDNLITLHQRELTKLKNIKKSCLEKMFV